MAELTLMTPNDIYFNQFITLYSIKKMKQVKRKFPGGNGALRWSLPSQKLCE